MLRRFFAALLVLLLAGCLPLPPMPSCVPQRRHSTGSTPTPQPEQQVHSIPKVDSTVQAFYQWYLTGIRATYLLEPGIPHIPIPGLLMEEEAEYSTVAYKNYLNELRSSLYCYPPLLTRLEATFNTCNAALMREMWQLELPRGIAECKCLLVDPFTGMTYGHALAQVQVTVLSQDAFAAKLLCNFVGTSGRGSRVLEMVLTDTGWKISRIAAAAN